MDTRESRFEQAKQKIIGADRKRSGIGTLSEKTVHAVLKHYYAPDEDMHEIPIENYVADIYTGTEIIEIQTRQFNKMRSKLEAFLPLYPVTIVYPIPCNKWVVWIDEESGELTKKRKSPAHGTVSQAFPELYKIKMFLKDPNLKLCLTLMDMEEYRLLNGWSRDRKKGSTRYDRIPLRIAEEVEICCLQDYMQFVPQDLPEFFTVKSLAASAHIRPQLAQVVMNLLYYAGTVKRVGKESRSWLYKVTK